MDRYLLLCIFSAEHESVGRKRSDEKKVSSNGHPRPVSIRGTMTLTLVAGSLVPLFWCTPAPEMDPGQ